MPSEVCSNISDVLHGQRLQKRNPYLYSYMLIAVTLTSSIPTVCFRLTL